MSQLGILTAILGAVVAIPCAWAVWRPAEARTRMLAFPRSRRPAWALAAIDLLWSAWLLWQMPMGSFDRWKPALFVLTPVLLVLVLMLMDDLLAARALGGLLLLIPSPLLEAARWHASSLRLVVVVLAYAMVVVGMVLVLSPHRLRKLLLPWAGDDHGGRMASVVSLLIALVVLLLGLTVY